MKSPGSILLLEPLLMESLGMLTPSANGEKRERNLNISWGVMGDTTCIQVIINALRRQAGFLLPTQTYRTGPGQVNSLLDTVYAPAFRVDELLMLMQAKSNLGMLGGTTTTA